LKYVKTVSFFLTAIQQAEGRTIPMVTTLGDLRRENRARATSTSSESARKRLFTRRDDSDPQLTPKVVGTLVAQTFDWDAQRIIEAFAIALQQVSVQTPLEPIAEGMESGEEAEPTSKPADKQEATRQAAATEQPAPNAVLSEAPTPTGTNDRPSGASVITDQFISGLDDRRTQTIAEMRQQFITLGELVLEAMGTADRGGFEAAG
jgi:hypothetical protein